MDRNRVFQALFNKLNESFSTASEAANKARELATHEQSKPETQYDTVGLEASYLAQGQSQRAQEIQLAIHDWKQLATKIFTEDDEISPGAIITLEDHECKTTTFLLGRHSGGVQLRLDDIVVNVISDQSPLGQSLINKVIGDEVASIGEPTKWLEIVNIG